MMESKSSRDNLVWIDRATTDGRSDTACDSTVKANLGEVAEP